MSAMWYENIFSRQEFGESAKLINPASFTLGPCDVVLDIKSAKILELRDRVLVYTPTRPQMGTFIAGLNEFQVYDLIERRSNVLQTFKQSSHVFYTFKDIQKTIRLTDAGKRVLHNIIAVEMAHDTRLACELFSNVTTKANSSARREITCEVIKSLKMWQTVVYLYDEELPTWIMLDCHGQYFLKSVVDIEMLNSRHIEICTSMLVRAISRDEAVKLATYLLSPASVFTDLFSDATIFKAYVYDEHVKVCTPDMDLIYHHIKPPKHVQTGKLARCSSIRDINCK